MKVSEFIKELQICKDYHGDIDIIDFIVEDSSQKSYLKDNQKVLTFTLKDRCKAGNKSYFVRIKGMSTPGFMVYKEMEL